MERGANFANFQNELFTQLEAYVGSTRRPLLARMHPPGLPIISTNGSKVSLRRQSVCPMVLTPLRAFAAV